MTITEEAPETTFQVIPLESLIPSEDNPRNNAADIELEGLMVSISEIGIKQALLVEPHPFEEGSFRIIAGHRRFKAARMACLTEVPCIVQVQSEEHRQATMFVENFHRKDLGAIEQARALKQLADTGLSQRDVAQRVGISQGQVSKLTALLKLPDEVQEVVGTGELSQEMGVTLASLPAEVITELCEDGPPQDWQIQQAKRAQERAEAKATLEKAAVAAGWGVLENDPSPNPKTSLEGTTEAAALDTNRQQPYGLLKHIDPKEHESEPCHAIYVDDYNGRVTPACTNPVAHPKPRGWKSPAEIKDAAARKNAGPASRGGDDYEASRARIAVGVATVSTYCTSALAKAGKKADGVLDFMSSELLGSGELYLGALDEAAGLLGIVAGKKVEQTLAAELEAKRLSGLELLYATVLADGLGHIEAYLRNVDRAGKIEKPKYFSDQHTLDSANRLITHLSSVVGDVPTAEDLAKQLLEAKGVTAAAKAAAKPVKRAPAKKAVKRIPAKRVAPKKAAASVADAPPKTPEIVHPPEASDQGTKPELEETEPTGPISFQPPNVIMRHKQGQDVITCSECGEVGRFDSPTDAGDAREAHLATVHALREITTEAPAVPFVTPFKKRGKFYLTCSVCSQLEGFNTNEADAETRGRLHVEEKHAELLEAAS